jgi:hypothetical protein
MLRLNNTSSLVERKTNIANRICVYLKLLATTIDFGITAIAKIPGEEREHYSVYTDYRMYAKNRVIHTCMHTFETQLNSVVSSTSSGTAKTGPRILCSHLGWRGKFCCS